jgi:hypothetical protein
MDGKTALEIILPYFPNSIVYKNDELILIPKINLYFRIDNISDKRDFSRKMIEWLSRPAHKGTSSYWQNYICRGINSYFGTTWNKKELSIIYTKLGNGVNPDLCYKFIDNNLDISILQDAQNDNK